MDEIACKAIWKKFNENGAVACKSSQLFPRTCGVLARVPAEFLRGSCGLLSKPTLSQLFPRKELQNCQNDIKSHQTLLFLRSFGGSQTLSQLFPRTVGKELGKSWERAETSRASCEIFGHFVDSLQGFLWGSCGVSCSVPCRPTLSQGSLSVGAACPTQVETE